MVRRKGKGLFGRKEKHHHQLQPQQQQHQQQQQQHPQHPQLDTSNSSAGDSKAESRSKNFDEKEAVLTPPTRNGTSPSKLVQSLTLGQSATSCDTTTCGITQNSVHSTNRSPYYHVSQDPVHSTRSNHQVDAAPSPEHFSNVNHDHGGGTNYMFLPVHLAVEEVWRADTTDFRSGALALKLLHLSILNNHKCWEKDAIYSPDLNYDPSEAFLCVQATTEKYLIHWRYLCKERDRAFIQADKRRRRREERIQSERKRKQEQEALEVSNHSFDDSISCIKSANASELISIGSEKAKDSVDRISVKSEDRISVKSGQSIMSGDTEDEEDDFGAFGEELLDDRVFDLCEKESWEVWQNSLTCCASLVTFCVGPAWDHQLKERQKAIGKETQTNGYLQHNLINSRPPPGVHRSNSIDESISTLGTIDSSIASYRSSRISEGHSGVSQSLAGNMNSDNIYKHKTKEDFDVQSAYKRKVKTSTAKSDPKKRYPTIPEVLPIAILRFAASFSENFFPHILYPSSEIEIPLEMEKILKRGNAPDESFAGHYFDAAICKVVQEEQMWLMRRQEVGVAQQQLILALCCRGDLNEFTSDLWSTEHDLFPTANCTNNRREYARDENNVLRWSIPGAHSPVASMLQFWAESAIPGWPNELIGEDRDPVFLNTISRNSDHHNIMAPGARPSNIRVKWKQVTDFGAPDWEYISEIAIMASLLVKRGWRPPPHGRDGGGCIYGLMDLAEKGALLHRSDLSYFSSEESSTFRRLLIVQSSAAAFYTLRNLASRGCLPIKTVAPVTKTFCYFLSEMDPTISNVPKVDLFPLKNLSETELETKRLFETIHNACLFHTAQVLWTLLEHDSSAVKAIDAVIDISMPAKRLESLHSKPEDTHDPKLLVAVVAVRVLGASLWGDPPTKTGIPHLRIYWSLFLSMIVDIISSLPVISNSLMSPIRKHVLHSSSTSFHSLMSDVTIDPGMLERFYSTPTLLPLNNYHPMSLIIIHEVVIAVKRLVDGELTSESIEPLCRYEWEPFILLLERGLLPWLVALSNLEEAKGNETTFSSCHDDSHCRKIMDDVKDIFRQVMDFIFYVDDSPLSVFQSVIDSTSRRRLHILFFRLISPVLPVGDSISVGTSLIRRWVYGGGVTHRSNEWSRKCHEILSEAFAVYMDHSYGFKGGYVHAPSVRLVAIRAFITKIEANRFGDAEHRSISTSSLSSGKSSGNVDQELLARHASMVHWNDICSILFPFLLESLAFCNSDHNGIAIPDPTFNRAGAAEMDSKIIGSSFDLQQTAIQCLGEMFRSGHLDKENRVLIVDTMQQFACDTTLLVEASEKNTASNSYQNPSMNSAIGDELILLKIEMVWQLGLCLNTPFESLPQMHSDTPRIASILCEIATIYSKDSFALKIEKKMSILALMCLARLRMTTSGKAMLLAKETLLRNLPGSTSFLLKDLESSFKKIQVEGVYDGASETNISPEDSHSVASNIFVEASQYKRKYNLDKETRLKRLEGTTLDVHGIIQTVNELICRESLNNELQNELQTHIRVLCYEIIKNFTLSGLAIMSASQWIELLSSHKEESLMVHPTELEAISSLIASCAGFIIQCIISCDMESNDKLSMEGIYLTTFHCFKGDAITLVSEASRALFSIQATRFFSSQKHKNTVIWSPGIKSIEHGKKLEQNFTIFVKTIDIILESWGNSFENNTSSINRYLEPHLSLMFDILLMKETWPKNQVNTFPSEIVRMSFKVILTNASSQCQLLALQCTALVVDLLNKDQLCHLVGVISRERKDSLSKPQSEQSPQDAFEFQGVILDLIRQEMMCKRLLSEKKGLPKLQIKELSANETMSNDLESLESFIADEVSGVAAWLYSDQLLMCRVGARRSRYNGWIEITMRSSVNRIRRLVKLPNRVTLNNPEFPSSLWDILSQSQKTDQSSRRNTIDQVHNLNMEHLKGRICSDITENGDESLSRFSRMGKMNSILLNQPRHAESLGNVDKMLVENSITMKRSQSAGDLTAKPSSESLSDLCKHERQLNDKLSSVTSFLNNSLNISERNQADRENLKEVQRQFVDLCYPDSELDVSSKRTDNGFHRLKWGPQLKRAISILDRISFLQTHKVWKIMGKT